MDDIQKTAFRKACRILAVCSNDCCEFMPYAKAYAEKGIKMESDEDISAQALYILGNLEDWVGDVAEQIKGIMKRSK